MQAVDGIEREAVDSSNIASIGYCADRQVLAVEFKSGAIYHYFNVNLNLAGDFYGASSRGAFFAKFIKGKYVSEKKTGPCRECGINGIIGEPCTDCGCGTHVAATERRKDDGQPDTQFSR